MCSQGVAGSLLSEIGEVDPLAGLLYMAAWFSFFEKQLEGAPEDLQETLAQLPQFPLGHVLGLPRSPGKRSKPRLWKTTKRM